MIILARNVVPSEWNSVHEPIEFEFEGGETRSITNSTNISSFVYFFVNAFSDNPSVGDRIYVDSGIYMGFHTITLLTLIGTTHFIGTNTVYIGPQSTGNALWIYTPEFSLYAGYDTGEAYDIELPLKLIAKFTPSITIDFKLRFDVSGFLKSIFNIKPPTLGVDFSLFNRFRLRYAGHGTGLFGHIIVDEFYHVLNSSIPTDELMSQYFGTGRYLSSNETQIIFGCGKTILSLLDTTGVVINTEVESGDTGADYYYNDFNENDFLTQIS